MATGRGQEAISFAKSRFPTVGTPPADPKGLRRPSRGGSARTPSRSIVEYASRRNCAIPRINAEEYVLPEREASILRAGLQPNASVCVGCGPCRRITNVGRTSIISNISELSNARISAISATIRYHGILEKCNPTSMASSEQVRPDQLNSNVFSSTYFAVFIVNYGWAHMSVWQVAK